jgi:hypothetical protein
MQRLCDAYTPGAPKRANNYLNKQKHFGAAEQKKATDAALEGRASSGCAPPSPSFHRADATVYLALSSRLSCAAAAGLAEVERDDGVAHDSSEGRRRRHWERYFKT